MALPTQTQPTRARAEGGRNTDLHACRSRRVLRVVRNCCAVLAAMAAACAVQGQAPNGPLLLTTAAAVHDLAPELAPRAHVRLVGTVTYYDPLEHTLFVQDKTGGVYVGTDRAYPISYGDRVLVDGQASASYRTEVGLDPLIERLGRDPQPPAPPVSYSQLSTGRWDSKLITLRGMVRTVDVEPHQNVPILHMDLNLRAATSRCISLCR